MLQLYYESGSTQTTSTALWTNQYVPSTYSSLRIALTSSYSGYTSSYAADISSNKTYPSGGWIIFQSPKDLIPTSSGQYLADVYLTSEGDNSLIWDQANVKWIEAQFTWADLSEFGRKISENERAMVSGSDYDNIYKYEFEDNAIFNVYDN